MPFRFGHAVPSKQEPVASASGSSTVALQDGATPAASPPATPGPAAPEAQPCKFSDLPKGLVGWVGALQATAILAAAGFIGKLSVQHSLGLDLGSWSAQDLSLFAGRWIFDTLSIILTGIEGHPIYWGIPVAVVLLPPLLEFSLPEGHPSVRWATLSSAALSAVALLAVLLWCELPTLSLNDWLGRDPKSVFLEPGEGRLRLRSADLGVTLLVAKMGNLAWQDHTGCSATPPERLKPFLEHDNPSWAATSQLRLTYGLAVVACLFAWLTLNFHPLPQNQVLIESIQRALRLSISFVLLPLAATLLPYVYGKLLCPMSYPLVTLTYADGKVSSAPMLLLDSDDKEIWLRTAHLTAKALPEESVMQVRERSEVKLISYYGIRDILTDMLYQCQWAPSAAPQHAAATDATKPKTQP